MLDSNSRELLHVATSALEFPFAQTTEAEYSDPTVCSHHHQSEALNPLLQRLLKHAYAELTLAGLSQHVPPQTRLPACKGAIFRLHHEKIFSVCAIQLSFKQTIQDANAGCLSRPQLMMSLLMHQTGTDMAARKVNFKIMLATIRLTASQTTLRTLQTLCTCAACMC